MNGLHFGSSLGFGEVKWDAEKDNNYANCKDLLRIGIFFKASIDGNNMKGVLSYQVIGKSYFFEVTVQITILKYNIDRLVVFYFLFLASDGLYALYELTDITTPFTMDGLLKFTMDFGKLVSIIKIYGEWCVKNESTIKRGKKCLSMSDGDFDQLIEKDIPPYIVANIQIKYK